MTSGQGGNEPGTGGQPEQPPPYGQPPYGRPPYGQPPYGQPYGQRYGQPYGYVPAPAVPSGPPPEPRERPLTVRAGLGAFIASIVLGLASLVLMAADWDAYVRQAMAQQAELGNADPAAAQFAEATAEVLAVAAIVIGVLFSALFLLFVWFAWKGHNWARIVLWVLGGFGVVTGLSGLAVGASLPSMTVLGVFQLLALVTGVVLLALAPSSDWFSHEKWRRTVTGPRRGLR